MTLLIIGASVAGLRTAQALRMKGYDGPITLLGEEPHLPYDKPPLSKDMILPDGDPDPVLLATEEQLAELDLDLRLGVRAAALDVERRVVTTEAGAEIPFGTLVLATGATPRLLPGTERLLGVHTIRTIEDVERVRTELAVARHVVVIGAGFIGAEFAAAAARHGTTVTLVEAQEVPLAHVLGPETGSRLAQAHAAAGNELVAGVGVHQVEGDDRVTAVVLEDGRRLPADLVVVGIGAVPTTAWLEGAGLPISDGIECTEDLTVVGHRGIYAAGDVARWPHGLYPGTVRIEHWTNANDHAAIIAASVTGSALPAPQVPYVWSDQYGHRIQIVGRPATGTLVHLTGTLTDGDLVAVYVGSEDEVVGAVVVDDTRLLMKCRKAVKNGSVWTDLPLPDATQPPVAVPTV